MYVPPKNSPFYSGIFSSGLQQLEEFIATYHYLDHELLINGDVNAKNRLNS
jgi:hypothetical protein